MLSIQQWTGPCEYVHGVLTPSMHLCKTEAERDAHQTIVYYPFGKHSCFTYVPLNQVCGPPPYNGELAWGLTNSIYRLLQCSPNGPDVFPELFRRPFKDNLSVSFSQPKRVAVTVSHTCIPPTIVSNSDGKESTKRKWRKETRKATRMVKNNAAHRWNQAPSLIVEKLTLTSVTIVSQINGSPLNLDISSSLDESFKEKLVVPSWSNFHRRTLWQKFYVIDLSVASRLVKKNREGGGLEHECDSFVDSLGDLPVTLLCVNDCHLWDGYPNYNMHSWVFAGECSPNLDQLQVIKIEELSLHIHYGIFQSVDVDAHQSLSTSLVDPRLHG